MGERPTATRAVDRVALLKGPTAAHPWGVKRPGRKRLSVPRLRVRQVRGAAIPTAALSRAREQEPDRPGRVRRESRGPGVTRYEGRGVVPRELPRACEDGEARAVRSRGTDPPCNLTSSRRRTRYRRLAWNTSWSWSSVAPPRIRARMQPSRSLKAARAAARSLATSATAHRISSR